MSKAEDLDLFVRQSIAAGRSFDDIRAVLAGAGWDTERAERALAAYVEADYPIAVPRPTPYASPRMFFLHFFYFIVLYLLTYNTISVLFTALDVYLPDGLGRYGSGVYYASNVSSAIRDNLAVIVICGPLMLLMGRTIHGAEQGAAPTPHIRLQLAYLTLFFSGLVMLGNGVSFVYYLLSGELGLRFMLKVAILSTLAIGLYTYYRVELRQDEDAI